MPLTNGPVPTFAPPAPAFQLWTYAQLKNYIPEPLEWMVEGLFPLGSASMLAAREKTGKTFLLIDLICSVAAGQEFLSLPTIQANALLIATEDHIREIQSRVLTRLAGVEPEGLFIMPPRYVGLNDQDLRLDDDHLIGRLKATIEEYEIKIVALDPLRELHDQKENESDDMAPTVRVLREIAHELNVAIVVSHHSSRAGRYRGSTAIGGSVDQILEFTRKDEKLDDDAEWEVASGEGSLRINGRYGPKRVIRMQMGDDHRWSVTSAALQKPAHEAKEANLRGRIVDALRQYEDGLTCRELAPLVRAAEGSVRNELGRILIEPDPPIYQRANGNPSKPSMWFAYDPLGIYFAGEEERPHDA